MLAVVGIPFALPKTALGFGSVSASQDIPAPASQAAQGKPDTPAVLLIYCVNNFHNNDAFPVA